jgi:flagellar hook-associated protein 1 FlgK
MPISSFSGLNLSLRALLAEQRGLDTTAQNIANANTVGYTRQEAVFSASAPYQVQAGALQNGAGAQLGQGVDVLTYQRVRDQFSDLQFRAQQMTLGQQQTVAEGLDQAQDLLSEPGGSGLQSMLSKFFDSWQTLASNPTSTAAQNAVLGQAKVVTDQLNAVAKGLTDLQANASGQITNLLDPNGPVKAKADEIAQLNVAIGQATALGQQPNDLLDRRDQLLDDLSKIGSVSVTDQGNGRISVGFAGVTPQLVDATNTVNLPAAASITSGSGGTLGGLADLASPTGTVASLLTDLDGIASGLATSVNTAYGSAFFSGATAATIAVGATSVTAASATEGPGGNARALAVAGQREQGPTLATYADFVARVGAEQAGAAQKATTAKTLAAATEERRQSVNGVSMDEEMTNLVRFQRGYQAASRAFSTMDEMLDVLINRTGRVGL